MARNVLAVIAVAVVVVFIVVVESFYTVNEGDRGVILRLGKVVGVAEPGFGLKMPFTDNIVSMTVRTQKEQFPELPSYSKDVQEAVIRVSVNFHVPPDAVDEVYARFGIDYASRIIDPVVPQRLKEVFGQFQAAAVVAERTRLGQELERAVRDTVAQNSGNLIAIDSVQIENIDFSDAYENAIEAAAQAEAEVRKSRNELERQKIEAEKLVVQAKAQAESTRQQAQADADRIRLRGEAEAAAVKAKGDALRENPNLVTLIAAEKWDGRLPTTQVPGAAVPFIELPQRAPSLTPPSAASAPQ
jgi:regulator of protease activity HflC (stomatin/prohibitin superfamily)